LREFEEGVRMLKCNKFKGRGEKERIANIFRYLDPSGEGQVSRSEWGVINNLWKEMRQSIYEFVRFLEKTFSQEAKELGEDVMDVAWDALDQDGGGDIDEREWEGVVRDELKYFGPTLIIFGFLDKDDEGTVSREEFHALKDFQIRFQEEMQAKRSMNTAS